jgi:hypothetical protein
MNTDFTETAEPQLRTNNYEKLVRGDRETGRDTQVRLE